MASVDYRELLLTTIAHQGEELASLVQTFPADAATSVLKPDNWTLREHLHHMRVTEGRYVDRLEGVLRDGEYAPPPQQSAEPPEGATLESMIEDFASARARELEILHGLSEPDWARTFTHPTIWGEVTIEWWAERIVQHTAEHLDELWMLRQLAGLTPSALERVQNRLASGN